jgi:hypothetical protein
LRRQAIFPRVADKDVSHGRFGLRHFPLRCIITFS